MILNIDIHRYTDKDASVLSLKKKKQSKERCKVLSLKKKTKQRKDLLIYVTYCDM